jgi:ATP synthase in type III secretion protein N
MLRLFLHLKASGDSMTPTPVPSNTQTWADALQGAVATLPGLERCGRVVRALGTIIEVTGLNAKVGDVCEFMHPGSSWRLRGEVIGIAGEHVTVLPLGSLEGISTRTQAVALGKAAEVNVGEGLLGHVLDGFGKPLTPGANLELTRPCLVKASPPDALHRRPVSQILPTGVRAIDGLITCGVGQRLGIFAPAGAGKSTLLSMIAQGSQCDVVVLALVGERGREVGEFLDELRGLKLLERSIVIVATSDKSSAERAKAPEVAMACAEYFRDQGQSVLLLMDSVTRYARALREIGLAAGEPPTRRGYPPSVFNALPRLFERAGCAERGVITAFFTVLVDDDAAGDPIFEETRATLDGHILLSPRLADGGHYPAIDVLGSRSRVMQKITTPAHAAAARALRGMLQKLQDIETLVQIGEYRSGSDLLADRALASREQLMQFLQQERHDISPQNTTLAQLLNLGDAAPGNRKSAASNLN